MELQCDDVRQETHAFNPLETKPGNPETPKPPAGRPKTLQSWSPRVPWMLSYKAGVPSPRLGEQAGDLLAVMGFARRVPEIGFWV